MNEILIAASPEEVFAVLADPERYAEWVIGTTETDGVDGDWPQPGAKLRYRAGIGPLSFSDVTEVVVSEPSRRLVLHARMRPFGVTKIELLLEPAEAGTALVLREGPMEGLVAAVHTKVSDAILARRNEAALARLRQLVEAGAAASG